jgi:quercetin dioxygenase-like cupin family protein
MRGLQVVTKAAGVRTPAGPTLLEFRTPPGASSGAHIHRTMEELFYVVAGEFELQVRERTFRAGPGTVAFVPPGLAHGFGNPGTEPATLLIAVSPAEGHFERYFEEVAALIAKPGPPDAAAIAELRQRYDTEQLPRFSPKTPGFARRRAVGEARSADREPADARDGDGSAPARRRRA